MKRVYKFKPTVEQKNGQAGRYWLPSSNLVCGPVLSLAYSRDCQSSVFVEIYTDRWLGAAGKVGMA